MDRLVPAIPETYRYIGNPLGHDLPEQAQTQDVESVGVKLGPFTAEKYPLLKYWNKDLFKPDAALRAVKARCQDGKPISKFYLFCENEKGDPISDVELMNVKEDIRIVFNGWSKPSPQTFRLVTWPQRKQLYGIIYPKWPFLQLCSNDWKLKNICTLIYPQWITGKKSGDSNEDSEDEGE